MRGRKWQRLSVVAPANIYWRPTTEHFDGLADARKVNNLVNFTRESAKDSCPPIGKPTQKQESRDGPAEPGSGLGIATVNQ
ncbi:MAG: hypothetical protein AB4352_06595 [Hormoscilla sp.]